MKIKGGNVTGIFECRKRDNQPLLLVFLYTLTLRKKYVQLFPMSSLFENATQSSYHLSYSLRTTRCDTLLAINSPLSTRWKIRKIRLVIPLPPFENFSNQFHFSRWISISRPLHLRRWRPIVLPREGFRSAMTRPKRILRMQAPYSAILGAIRQRPRDPASGMSSRVRRTSVSSTIFERAIKAGVSPVFARNRCTFQRARARVHRAPSRKNAPPSRATSETSRVTARLRRLPSHFICARSYSRIPSPAFNGGPCHPLSPRPRFSHERVQAALCD